MQPEDATRRRVLGSRLRGKILGEASRADQRCWPGATGPTTSTPSDGLFSKGWTTALQAAALYFTATQNRRRAFRIALLRLHRQQRLDRIAKRRRVPHKGNLESEIKWTIHPHGAARLHTLYARGAEVPDSILKCSRTRHPILK